MYHYCYPAAFVNKSIQRGYISVGIFPLQDNDPRNPETDKFGWDNKNTHWDDGSQSLYGPGTQGDVGEDWFGKACLQQDPIGVVPDLKRNKKYLLDFHFLIYRNLPNFSVLYIWNRCKFDFKDLQSFLGVTHRKAVLKHIVNKLEMMLLLCCYGANCLWRQEAN